MIYWTCNQKIFTEGFSQVNGDNDPLMCAQFRAEHSEDGRVFTRFCYEPVYTHGLVDEFVRVPSVTFVDRVFLFEINAMTYSWRSLQHLFNSHNLVRTLLDWNQKGVR